MIYNKEKLYETNGYLDLTHSEVKTIAAFVIRNERMNSNSSYLEIGVFGGGTIKFLKSVTATTHFTGIDLFENFTEASDNTHVSGSFRRDDVQEFLGDRTHLIKGNSHDVLPTLNQKFNFIFIDGNHTYKATMQDFNDAQKLLVPGGQIAFHNASTHIGPDDAYIQHDGGPWQVIQEIMLMQNWRLIESNDRLRVFTQI